MQNKGLIKFFAILFALVSIYQLSFTFVSQNVENDAKIFAKGNSEKELKYLVTYDELFDIILKKIDLSNCIECQLSIALKKLLQKEILIKK